MGFPGAAMLSNGSRLQLVRFSSICTVRLQPASPLVPLAPTSWLSNQRRLIHEFSLSRDSRNERMMKEFMAREQIEVRKKKLEREFAKLGKKYEGFSDRSRSWLKNDASSISSNAEIPPRSKKGWELLLNESQGETEYSASSVDVDYLYELAMEKFYPISYANELAEQHTELKAAVNSMFLDWKNPSKENIINQKGRALNKNQCARLLERKLGRKPSIHEVAWMWVEKEWRVGAQVSGTVSEDGRV